MGYLGKAHNNQTEAERHKTLSNLVLKRKLRKSVQFVRDKEKVGVFQPYWLSEYHIDTINEIVALVLGGKTSERNIPSYAKLETYEKMPIFIPVAITEEAVELVPRKISGVSGLGGTDS